VPHTRFRDEAAGVAQWEYYVRRPAAAVLTEWKVEFKMPVVKRPVEGPTTR
jgi:hypothetical protein